MAKIKLTNKNPGDGVKTKLSDRAKPWRPAGKTHAPADCRKCPMVHSCRDNVFVLYGAALCEALLESEVGTKGANGKRTIIRD